MSGVAVVGIGNEWRRDDAAGLVVARLLRGMPGVAVIESEGEPIGLLDAWGDADAVILVDAVSSGAEPGTVHRIDAASSRLPSELGSSTHTVSLGEAVELARALHRLPANAVVYGIEGEDFTAGEGLTPRVERAAREVAAAVRRELEALA